MTMKSGKETGGRYEEDNEGKDEAFDELQHNGRCAGLKDAHHHLLHRARTPPRLRTRRRAHRTSS